MGSICKSCGSSNLELIETPNSIHYAKIMCRDCGLWNKFIKNPNSQRIRTKTSKYKIDQVLKFYNKKEAFCFFCLRKKEELGEFETITIDHIEELNKGGKDELQNLQILCSACHKLKNWTRLYMNWHLKKLYKE